MRSEWRPTRIPACVLALRRSAKQIASYELYGKNHRGSRERRGDVWGDCN